MRLELREVTYCFSELPESAPWRSIGLDSLSLSLSKGELLAIVGENGAGKTTLLRLMAGLLEAPTGQVLLDGTPIRNVLPGPRARSLAYLPQSEPDPVGFTVREVVMMGRGPHQGVWHRASERDCEVVEQSLAQHDLLGLAERSVGSLSGGERKRVALARASAQQASILLLDEPAAFLDLRRTLSMFHELRAQCTERGLACAVTVHDLSLVERFAHRVALLKEGRLLAIGPVKEVLTPEALEQTFGVPFRVTVTGEGRVLLPEYEAISRHNLRRSA